MVEAILSCDPSAAFNSLCTFLAVHDPTHTIGPVLERSIGPILVFIVIYLLGRIVRRIAERAIKRAHGDQQVRALVHNVTTATTYLAAILSAFVAAGLSLSILLTFGGLTTLAVGLAFQGLLSNIISGIYILLERPFRIGDSITVTGSVNPAIGVTGTVLTVTLRTTTLKMPTGELASIPNLTVFSNLLVNNSEYAFHQQSFAIRVNESENLRPMIDHIRSVLGTIAEVELKPAATIQPEPQVDGGFLVKCSYWVNRKKHNIDSIAGTVASALWVETTPPPSIQEGSATRR